MKKKQFVIILGIILISLVACGKKNEEKEIDELYSDMLEDDFLSEEDIKELKEVQDEIEKYNEQIEKEFEEKQSVIKNLEETSYEAKERLINSDVYDGLMQVANCVFRLDRTMTIDEVKQVLDAEQCKYIEGYLMDGRIDSIKVFNPVTEDMIYELKMTDYFEMSLSNMPSVSERNEKMVLEYIFVNDTDERTGVPYKNIFYQGGICADFSNSEELANISRTDFCKMLERKGVVYSDMKYPVLFSAEPVYSNIDAERTVRVFIPWIQEEVYRESDSVIYYPTFCYEVVFDYETDTIKKVDMRPGLDTQIIK